MKFDFEWQEAPGVRDQVLAATWARLSLKVDGLDVLEAIDSRSQSRRTDVYGSVFPLSQWLVENWWHLLNEPALRYPIPGGRTALPEQLSWVRRHNLLAAREGGAFPDLTIARDGGRLCFSWRPDPAGLTSTRLRFVGEGYCWVETGAFEEAVGYLVRCVLARLEARVSANSEVEQFNEAWEAICAADAAEKELCRSLAILGVDPYDPDEATESLVEAVERSSRILPTELHDDLLESAGRDSLLANLEWIQRQAAGLRQEVNGCRFPTIELVQASTPHETGYWAARRVRSELLGISSDEAIVDLPSLLVDRLGWAKDCSRKGLGEVSLEGMVGLDLSSSAPLLIDARARKHEESERFLLARAAFFPVSKTLGSRGRLLSPASTPAQRTARAFAAELLAPSAALEKTVSGQVGEEELEELAERFKVSPLVIEHQIQNHRLGYINA